MSPGLLMDVVDPSAISRRACLTLWRTLVRPCSLANRRTRPFIPAVRDNKRKCRDWQGPGREKRPSHSGPTNVSKKLQIPGAKRLGYRFGQALPKRQISAQALSLRV